MVKEEKRKELEGYYAPLIQEAEKEVLARKKHLDNAIKRRNELYHAFVTSSIASV